MRLSEYLHEPGAAAVFARRLGVAVQNVYRWRDGACRPRPKMMRRIERETEGAVTLQDFFADERAHQG